MSYYKPKPHQQSKWHRDRNEKIVWRYEHGESVKDIAEIVRLAEDYVRTILRDMSDVYRNRKKATRIWQP